MAAMLDLCFNGTLTGLLLQQPFYGSSGNFGIEKQNAHACNDHLIENLYFNDNRYENKNSNISNDNSRNTNNNITDNCGKQSEIVGQENHGNIGVGITDNHVLNSSFDIGSHLVDSQWSLEEFLLGASGAVVNGLVGEPQQTRTYVPDVLSSGASSPNSSRSSPMPPSSPRFPQSPQSPQFVQSAQPLRSPASSTTSGSLDDLLDDLEIRSPYGSPSNLAINSPYGSPTLSSEAFANTPYSSSSSLSSVSSPSGLGSPYGSGSSYGSPGSSVVDVDPLEEILGNLSAPLTKAQSSQMEFEVQTTVMETSTTEVLESSCPSLTVGVQHGNVLNGNVVGGGCTLVDLLTNCISAPIPHVGAAISSSHMPSKAQATVDSNISLLQLLQPTQAVKEESSSLGAFDFSTVPTQNQGLSSTIQPPTPSTNILSNLDQPSNPTPFEQPTSISPAVGNGEKGGHRFAPYKSKPRTEAQKERKKEHNRKSASKYRSKKKQELEVKTSELELVEQRNMKLKANVEDLRKEIDYLKTLMLDCIRARMEKKEKEEKKVTNGDLNVEAILLALAK